MHTLISKTKRHMHVDVMCLNYVETLSALFYMGTNAHFSALMLLHILRVHIPALDTYFCYFEKNKVQVLIPTGVYYFCYAPITYFMFHPSCCVAHDLFNCKRVGGLECGREANILDRFL